MTMSIVPGVPFGCTLNPHVISHLFLYWHADCLICQAWHCEHGASCANANDCRVKRAILKKKSAALDSIMHSAQASAQVLQDKVTFVDQKIQGAKKGELDADEDSHA